MSATGLRIGAPTGWRGWLLDPAPASRRQARLGRWYRAWLGLCRNGLAMTGLVIVLALVVVAILAPLFADHAAAFTQTLEDRLQPMSWAHPFGTDELGRDIYARVIFGSRITLTIVALVSVIVVPVGLGIGLPAGYFGGWIDAVLMRITDIFLAFPRLVLALAFAAALGPGIENAVIAISLTAWPPYARLARAETLTRRQRRVHRGGRTPGRLAPAHPVHADHAAQPALGHHPPHARYGRHHSYRRRPRFPRPRRPAACPRMGRHGLLRPAVPA